METDKSQPSSSAPPRSDSLPILIVGAGISGLILAQYLRRSGIAYQIFERDASIAARAGGWGLTLHWALPALYELLPEDVKERLPETFVNKEAVKSGDKGRYQFFDLASGEALCSVPAAERIRVSRSRFRQLLTTGVDVQWSKPLQDVQYHDDSVTVRFEDGTSYQGSIVVACDGSRSRVRRSLYPSNYRNAPLPIQLLGATTRYSVDQATAVRALDPFFFQGTHSESNVYLYFSFLDSPFNFDDSPDGYLCQVVVSWSNDRGVDIPTGTTERIALMKSLTEDWAEPFRSLVHDLPDDADVVPINIEDWMQKQGTNEQPRAVLLGDSAHSMTMFRGEGANNAIVDVLDFTKRVDLQSISKSSSASIHESIRAYEKDMTARAGPSVENSRKACLDAHDFSIIKAGNSPLVARRVLK
ncbi:FAD binding domain protein [Aspergillus steynii IBT 23096]|uniref:FAD binding domain protein n=1 Tax=Aspergillus steynii IBT 23096 TaxID=1392250 RepID=A0A2I2GHN3_9EURO|nr:FAD binding domain protein [Aspergillus steynii IBT 23096]PLB52389.1 FAD binding domain protein [Aspergillus steynii IBT 23096]